MDKLYWTTSLPVYSAESRAEILSIYCNSLMIFRQQEGFSLDYNKLQRHRILKQSKYCTTTLYEIISVTVSTAYAYEAQRLQI